MSKKLTSFRVFYDNNDVSDINMAAGVTLKEAKEYFITGIAVDYDVSQPLKTRKAVDVAELCEKENCTGHYNFEKSCGAFVCCECNDHKGMARCYCNWAADGGNGRDQLVEMGETIDEEM
jgi:hypothetical protein